LYQHQVLDLIQDRGLVQYLKPNEIKWVIAARSFYCEVAYGRERFADALVDAERILAIAPDDPNGLMWKGTALGRMGKPDDAAILFEQAVASPAISAMTLTRVAHFYLYWSPQRAWKTRALPLLERALVIEPQNTVALRILAEYWMDQNKCNDALGFLKQAIVFNPKDTSALGAMGNAYWCLGDKANAKTSYRQAIQLDPRLEPYFRERLNAP
jgi:Flp pilus assembly protein TadD